MINKYVKPYCYSCRLIFGSSSQLNCNKCGRPLIFKSFNPLKTLLKGLGFIFLGSTTLFMQWVPIIWIGGFLYGGSLIFNGFKQWSEIKTMDRSQEPSEKNEPVDDKDHIVITCGICSKKFKVRRGQGITQIKCPDCFNIYKIKT